MCKDITDKTFCMFVLLIVFPKPKCCNAFFSFFFFSKRSVDLYVLDCGFDLYKGVVQLSFLSFWKGNIFSRLTSFFRGILASLLPNPLIKATLLACLKKRCFHLFSTWSNYLEFDLVWCSPHNYPVKTIWRLKLKFLFFIFHLTLE